MQEVHAGEIERFNLVTPWLSGSEEDEAEAAARAQRHALFGRLALEVLYSRMPWLAQLLDRVNGQVLAAPGRFFIAAPAGSENWIEIPELSERICLVPWAEPDETPQ